jgi:hypothetical protein
MLPSLLQKDDDEAEHLGDQRGAFDQGRRDEHVRADGAARLGLPRDAPSMAEAASRPIP